MRLTVLRVTICNERSTRESILDMTGGMATPLVLSTQSESDVAVQRETDIGVAAIYRERRSRFGAERDALTARWNRLANLRLVAFLVAAAFVVWAVGGRIWWPLGPAGLALALFVGLVIRHRQVGRTRQRAA